MKDDLPPAVTPEVLSVLKYFLLELGSLPESPRRKYT
jgi:hypothetical protein